MSFGTDLPEIDAIIQEGYGIAASVLGQTYSQYRLQPGITNGSVVSGKPIATGVPAYRDDKAKKQVIEGETFGLLVYDFTCDSTQLEIGDVFVETGYRAEVNDFFTVAQALPRKRPLLVRTEFNCSLTRPRPHAGQSSQQPTSGWIAQSGYAGVDDASEWFLTLSGGLYGFTNTPGASPASVQCGLVQQNRIRDNNALGPGAPVEIPRAHFVVYVPDLPGQPLEVYDRIKFPNADKYEILSFYNSEDAGFHGTVCLCEKV